MKSEDDLLQSLPSHDVDPRIARQIRQRAHAALEQQARRSRQPRGIGPASRYHRFIEPALLLGLGFSYLVLSVQHTVALFH